MNVLFGARYNFIDVQGLTGSRALPLAQKVAELLNATAGSAKGDSVVLTSQPDRYSEHGVAEEQIIHAPSAPPIDVVLTEADARAFKAHYATFKDISLKDDFLQAYVQHKNLNTLTIEVH